MFILTLRNDGLGDLVLSLPTLAALRARYPAARLGVVIDPRRAALLELYPDAVEVWPDAAENRAQLRQKRPDVVLFLRPDPHWARAAFFARVPRRIGTRHRWQSLFFNEKADVHRRAGQKHEAECNLLVARSLGINLQPTPVRLTVPGRYLEQARSQREELGIALHEPYVILHPGSHGSSPNWPPRSYAELTRSLTGRGLRVLVTGAASETALAGEVAGVAGCVAGATDLGTLAAHLFECATVVSGSTGPMHLAAALGVRVVAMFSNAPTHSPVRWGPLGEGHAVLQAHVTRRAGHPPDLSSLGRDEVNRAVDRVLQAHGAVP